MQIFEYVLILLAAILLSNLISRFLPSLSAPLVQIGLGCLIAVIPFGPFGFAFELEPELFFVLFIAPLVFYASMESDKKTLWEMKKPILGAALLLVVITTAAVGFLVRFMIPQIPLAAAFALIAALGPIDDVAVDAVERRVEMPKKIMGILIGESLISDASGIVCFQFALLAVESGSFSALDALWQLAVVGLGGIVFGAVCTMLKYALVSTLRKLGMTNATLFILIGILSPFIIYMSAESLGSSGVLAVFASGILHSFYKDKLNPETVSMNIALDDVWSVVSFTFDGLVFVMLGTQLPDILMTMFSGEYSISGLGIAGVILAITLSLNALRFVWWVLFVKPQTYIEEENPVSRAKGALLFSLAGARGTVTLVSVMSIPLLLADGSAFPERDLMILISSGVIVLSLAVTNFILPLFVPSNDESSRSAKENAVYVEIIEGVISRLNAEADSTTRLATESVARTYSARLGQHGVMTRPDRVKSSEERAIKEAVIEWEKENVAKMIENSEASPESLEHYLEVLNLRDRPKQKGKAKHFIKLLFWAFGNLLRSGSPNSELRALRGSDILAIRSSNAAYVLEKLKGLPDSESPAVKKVVSEYETAMQLNDDGLGRLGRVLPSEALVMEIAAKGFQIERELIQGMYETNRISWETAKEMRGNIITLEALISKDSEYYSKA